MTAFCIPWVRYSALARIIPDTVYSHPSEFIWFHYNMMGITNSVSFSLKPAITLPFPLELKIVVTVLAGDRGAVLKALTCPFLLW